MDQNLIAKIQVIAHIPIVSFPCKLDITATVVAIGIGFTVAAFDRNGVTVGHALALAILLNWLPLIGVATHARILAPYSNNMDEVTNLRGVGNARRMVISEVLGRLESPIVLL